MASTFQKIFVYGTLKRGEPNHQWFSNLDTGHHKFLYEAKTVEKFPLIIATEFNIPFLLCSPGNGKNVYGEVYEVDDKVLADLDKFEDHPNFYIRDSYKVQNINDPTFQEKVYMYMIKTFKPEFLKKETYESYSNNGHHGLKYVTRYLRGDTNSHKEIFKMD